MRDGWSFVAVDEHAADDGEGGFRRLWVAFAAAVSAWLLRVDDGRGRDEQAEQSRRCR